MALETLTSSELLNFIIFETLSATQFSCNEVSSENKILLDNNNVPKQESQQDIHEALNSSCAIPIVDNKIGTEIGKKDKNLGVQGGRKKRRRRQKVCKNEEEAETQRMTHIVVERNRRKQMNQHLSVLRSLMPESYVQRGDQASIVGGAIEFVKRLEHTLQSLESAKFQVLKQRTITTTVAGGGETSNVTTTTCAATTNSIMEMQETSPFAGFFSYPQYSSSQSQQKLFTSKSKGATADIEVTLVETHANVRILSQTRLRQLSKLVAAFQTLYLTILHLNVTTLDPLVLYSISAKVEEGCQLCSAEDIGSAINHILRIIEEELLIDSRCM